jgi:dTDP-glucose 4,6-dehydratase
MPTIMVTGGQGFIGSNLLVYLRHCYPETKIINLDGFTYAARPTLLSKKDQKAVAVEKIDIRDQAAVEYAFEKWQPDHVIHLAAESHVCRSITGPKDFVYTNVVGTFHLLEAFRRIWHGNLRGHRFHHVSTDEVFGQLGERDKAFSECTPVAPRSPYAATKCASDHLVTAYHETYGLDTVITNCSNNFGPNQHAEKLIPKTIESIFHSKPMTVYGAGTQVRDWLYVEDHCRAIDTVFRKGKSGQRYCIGGDMELSNIDIIKRVYEISTQMRRNIELKLVHTNDRPTDDFRYAISNLKINKLGWGPSREDFDAHLRFTILWYWDKLKREGARSKDTTDGVHAHG